MSPLVLGAGMAFFAGLVLVAVGVVGPPQRSRAQRAAGETLRDLLPTIREGEEQNLRLAGITPESYAVQRVGGLCAGLAAGLVLAVVLGRGLVGTLLLTVLVGAGGWVLPMMGVRVADGLPASVLTDAETDLVLGSASGCVDWPAAMNRSYLTAGSPQPQEPPACLLEAAEAGHFSREGGPVDAVRHRQPCSRGGGPRGEGCFTEATRTQAVQTMTAEGVSDESAQCFADGTVELLLSADSDSAGSYEEFLAMGMLSAMLDCLTEAEIEQLSGGPQ